MPTLIREFRYSLRRFAPIILMVFCLVYIYYHTISGERGLATWYTLRQQVQTLHTENQALKKQILQLQARVGRLNKTFDHDYMEERTRKMLAVLHPEEVVIFFPPNIGGADLPK